MRIESNLSVSDSDDDTSRDNVPNPEAKQETKKTQQKKARKAKKPRIKLDAQRLTNPDIGIKKFYLKSKSFVPSGNPVRVADYG